MESKLATYTSLEHTHRFATWTAACATRRTFTKNKLIARAIDKTGLESILLERMYEKNITPEQFDTFHREKANLLISHFANDSIRCSYGRAVKILAIYLKTTVILPYSMCSLSRVAHPPIDNILLENLHREHPKHKLHKIMWITLNEEQCWDLIPTLRTFVGDNPF